MEHSKQETKGWQMPSMKVNKKGQAINLALAVIGGLFSIFFLVFLYLFIISSLNPGSFFGASSAEQNATNTLRANFTQGVGSLGQQFPTIMVIVGAVLIISIVLVLFRFAKSEGITGGSGTLG